MTDPLLYRYMHKNDGPLGRGLPVIITIIGLVVAAVLIGLVFLTGDTCPNGVAWLSWKDNVYPDCQTFEIREEGEYAWFGTIKAAYDLEVRPGQYVCVRVDTEGGDYGWYIMGYYGQNRDPEQPWHELKSWQSVGMLNYGIPEINLMPSGEWRCHQMPRMKRYSQDVPEPYILFKIHWCGFGKGGTVARPIVVVSDIDLSVKD